MAFALNEIAENIAYKLGDQFNHTLRESIKHTLIYYRSKYLRDDLDRNFLSYTDYLQTVTLELEKVNILNEFNASLCKSSGICTPYIDIKKYKILKTKIPVPKTIRFKSFGRVNYKYVGNVLHSKPFYFTTFEELKYRKSLPYQNNNIYYTIKNEHLFILNNLEICDVLIEGAFANPIDAFKSCKYGKFKDDNIFPIPEDMLVSISNNIVNKEYKLIKDGEVINIQKDDRD